MLFISVAALLAALSVTGGLFLRLVLVQSVDVEPARHWFAIAFGTATLAFALALADSAHDHFAQHSLAALWLWVLPTQSEIAAVLPLCVVASLALSLVLLPPLAFASLLVDLGIRRIPVIALLCGGLLVGLVLAAVRGAPEFQLDMLLSAALPRVGVVGVVAVSALAGYATVATPAALMFPFLARGRVEEARQLLAVLARRQRHLVGVWMGKRRQLALSELQQPGRATAALKAECDGFERLSVGLFLDQHDAAELLRAAQRGATRRFASFAAGLGAALSLYGVAKTAAVLLRFVSGVLAARTGEAEANDGSGGRGGTTEGRVAAIGVLLQAFDAIGVLPANASSEAAERAVLVHQLALVLTAVTIIMSVRGLLLLAFRVTSSYMTALSARTVILAFSEVFVLCLLAQLLQMQHRRVSTHELASRIPLLLFQRVSDAFFLVGCLGTLLVRRFLVSDATGAE